MTVDSSRWYEPAAPGGERARSVGWWSMLLGGIALLLFHATLVAAYVYLRWGHDTWPPPGFDIPDPGPALAVLAPIAAAAAVSWSLGELRRAARGRVIAGLALTALLGAVAAALRMLAYVDVGFRWDAHAYASLFWVLGVYEIVILVLGVVMTGVVLVQAVLGLHGPDRTAVLEVASLYWWFAVVTSVLSVGTLYAGPYL